MIDAIKLFMQKWHFSGFKKHYKKWIVCQNCFFSVLDQPEGKKMESILKRLLANESKVYTGNLSDIHALKPTLYKTYRCDV